MKELQKKLDRYMDARIPILYVDTLEDDLIESEIKELCRRKRRKVMTWSMRGFYDYAEEASFPQQKLDETLEMLAGNGAENENHVLIIRDAHYFLENEQVVTSLKYLAQQINLGFFQEEDGIDDFTIILVAPLMNIPRVLESYVTIVNVDALSESEIRKLVEDFVKYCKIKMPTQDLMDKLIMTFKGLNTTEIFALLQLAISDDGEIDFTDLPLMREQKQQMVKKSGVLDLIQVTETLEDIGGLEVLKKWLQRKAAVFQDVKKANDFGVATPKGVLIVGMPGCGKSLAAKAVARTFDLPLLRMDMGRLMGKYVGESEGNMRRAIALTEASSPCVLWIDELEKAFAGIGSGGSGSEVTTRLFGNFLTWMQEKQSLAFVVATANDITKLPPELLRKGRFDEIFYVNFPNEAERKKIFEIHIGKRRKADLPKIDLQQLVAQTKGYCGADIESVVYDSLENAFVAEKKELTTEDILAAIRTTHPITETMKDSLDKLAKAYAERKFKNASN